MVQCWAYEPSDRPTVHKLIESLHATGDTPLPVRKWDNTVLGRLRDPLVCGKIPIPPGLPPFLDSKGDGMTSSMTLLDNSSTPECIPSHDRNFAPPSNPATPESTPNTSRVPSLHGQAQQPSANGDMSPSSPSVASGPVSAGVPCILPAIFTDLSHLGDLLKSLLRGSLLIAPYRNHADLDMCTTPDYRQQVPVGRTGRGE